MITSTHGGPEAESLRLSVIKLAGCAPCTFNSGHRVALFCSHPLASALFKSSVQHPRTPLRKLLRPRSRRTPNLSPLSHRAHRPRRRRLRRRQIRRGRRAGGPDTLRRGGAKRPEHQSQASTAGRKPGPGGTEPFERPGPARLLGDGRLPRGPEVPHPQG